MAPEQIAVIEQALGDQMPHGMFALTFALQSPCHAEQESALESR